MRSKNQPVDKSVLVLMGALAAFFFPAPALWIIGAIAMFRTWRTLRIAEPSIAALRELAMKHQLTNVTDALFPRAPVSKNTGYETAPAYVVSTNGNS